MDRARKIAAFPSGRWAKWFVLAFWIAVLGFTWPLSSKLSSAEKNDASSWLPKNAESTQVVELAKRFTPSDVFPAVLVYERAGEVTAADQARATADARRFAGLNHVSGQIIGP